LKSNLFSFFCDLFHLCISAGALKNVVALAVGFVAGLKQEEQVDATSFPA
jgi:glycerol-3-phosphate dehydrogenase